MTDAVPGRPFRALRSCLRSVFMLPIPVGANRSRTFRRSRSARQELRTFLLTRSRLTNLAFILLSCLAGVSLLLNLQLYLTSNKAITPHGILATISRPTAYEELDHLIMVPGHSIWKGTDPGEHALLPTYARTEPSYRTTIQ